MSNGQRWSKFWWQDWQADKALRLCSIGARGLWMEMLCIAHEGEPYGHLKINGRDLTSKDLTGMITNITFKEVCRYLAELEEVGAFSRTADGTIYCRRMVRDQAATEYFRSKGKEGGNPLLNGKDHVPPKQQGGLTPPLSQPLSQGLSGGVKPPVILQEAEAKKQKQRESGGDSSESGTPARERARPPQPIPPDWQPSVVLVEFGGALGMTEATVQRSADRMVDWAKAGGNRKVDWEATFRNWLRRDAKETPFRNGALQLIREEGMPSTEPEPVGAFLARFPNGPH